MLNIFYSRIISKADRNQALVYRRRMESAPDQELKFWDDSKATAAYGPAANVQEAIQEEARLVQSIKTNFNMATVRFMRFMQELEIKYGFCMEDRLSDLDMDGTLTFHCNNIDGWHP